jgi:RHS repeat-associated protein
MIYDAWGNVVSRSGSTPTTRLWVGILTYYTDPETGLIWVLTRPLNPAAGRWTAADLLATVASEVYVAVHNNPCRYVDASGLIPWDVGLGSAVDWFDKWWSEVKKIHPTICDELARKIRGYLPPGKAREYWDHFTSGSGTTLALNQTDVFIIVSSSAAFLQLVRQLSALCLKEAPDEPIPGTRTVGVQTPPPYSVYLATVKVTLTYTCTCDCFEWAAQVEDTFNFDPRGLPLPLPGWVPGATDRDAAAEFKTILVRAAQIAGQCGWKQFSITGKMTSTEGDCSAS